jgi:pilus assembly protein CpaE
MTVRPSVSRPPMVVIAHSGNSDVMRLAMRGGARDFLARPIESEALLDTLRRIIAEDSVIASDGPVLSAVINAKGGSGATLLSANLAHLLAIKERQRVALVDLDLQFGTLGLYLDVHPNRGILEALEVADELDAVAVQAYLAKHKSGVHIMAAVQNRIALQGEIDAHKLNHILDTLMGSYDHVIVDLPRQIDLLTTTVLDRANHAVITTQQSLTHLRDTSRLRAILRDELGVMDNRLLVVVNRYDPKNPVTLSDIQETLKGVTLVIIPNDYKRVSENVNLGIPLYQQSHNAPITKAVEDLAARVCRKGTETRKPSLFNRMLGRFPGAGRSSDA